MLKELGFKKTAFWGITPFKVRDRKEWKSGKGKLKEWANVQSGNFVGSLPGIAIMLAALKNPGVSYGIGLPTTILGGLTGGIKSLRATEREAGVKPTNLPQFLGRVGGKIGGGFLVPVIGSELGDYYVSRHMQKH